MEGRFTHLVNLFVTLGPGIGGKTVHIASPLPQPPYYHPPPSSSFYSRVTLISISLNYVGQLWLCSVQNMRETSMRGQVLAMSVDHAGVSASSAPNTSKTREGEVEDEQSIENLASAAKSAFEITSVTTAADDELETSMVGRHPMSADAELLKGSGVLLRRKASGESQDNISISEDLKVEAATGNKSETSVGETIENSIAVSDADTKPAPGVLASHSQTHIQGVVGGNGPNVQLGASRFKRVNNYVRGRWNVRDTSEPEERPESSEMKQMGPKTIAENSTVATVSPSVTRRSTLTTEHSETHQHSRTSSDVGQSPPVPAAGQRELREGGGGGEGDSSSDRDAHLDRNSTAADTLSLSRTTSFSSNATAGEQKSIDGDEHLRDTDNESVASSVPGGTTPELHEPATPSTAASQSSQTATVSVASVPAATGSTAASSSTQEHPQNCTCESCSER